MREVPDRSIVCLLGAIFKGASQVRWSKLLRYIVRRYVQPIPGAFE
jgi:hypothetical protein